MKNRALCNNLAYAFFALAIICTLLVCAAPADRITGKIIEVGTFEFGPGQPGHRETHFTSHGDVITARLGSKFGFRFTLNNLPDAPSFDLKTAVTHPSFTNKEGTTETHYELTTTVPVANGSSTSITGYSFDHPEELVPGVWTFEHSYRGKILVKQAFTVQGPGGK